VLPEDRQTDQPGRGTRTAARAAPAGRHHRGPRQRTLGPLAGPYDDYLICLGDAATAVIVSGDSDLLGLADQIPVYTPTAFLALLAQT